MTKENKIMAQETTTDPKTNQQTFRHIVNKNLNKSTSKSLKKRAPRMFKSKNLKFRMLKK